MDDVLSETHAAREELFTAYDGARRRKQLEAWSRAHSIREKLAALEVERVRLLLALEKEEQEFSRAEAAVEDIGRVIAVEETRAAWAFCIRRAAKPLSVVEFTTLLNAKWGA